jgi:carbon storage regulator
VLVLSRKIGETIVVGKDIEVTILEIQGGEVRLGFNAPREVIILRKEILEEVENQNREAVGKLDPNVLDGVLKQLKKKP